VSTLPLTSVRPAAVRPARLAPLGAWVAAGAGAAAVAAVLAHRPPAVLVVAAAAAAVAVLALALARYDLVVGLGFLLLGVARVEPSPADALLGLAIAVAVVTGRFDLRRVPGPLLALLGLLLGLSVLSVTAAADLGAALRFLLITAYLLACTAWLVVHLRTEARMRLVVGAYVAGAVLSAAVAVPALFVAFPGHEALVGEGARAQALFKDPNVFGPFLVPAVLILLEEVLRPRLLGLRRRVSLPALLVVAVGVVFSYSRAAWLNLGVALAVLVLVLALRRGGGRAATGAVVLVLAGVAVAGGAVLASGSTGFLRERAGSHAYDTERFQAQRAGVALGADHPLGIGPGQFEHAGPISAHSIYVRVLAEQGALGLVALLALLGGTLLLAAANALAGRHALGVGSAPLLAAWCGLLVNGAFVDTLHWRHLWLVAALIWVAAVSGPGRARAG
jgi:O-antigen ligase